MKIATSRDSKRLDESVIADYGVSQAVLMENAALAARSVAEKQWGVRGREVLVVCGIGNNGGDGCALARLLYAQGAAVTLLIAGESRRMRGAAAENYAIVERLPLEILSLGTGDHPAILNQLDIDRFDYVVDALFGTGLSREITGRMAALVNTLNHHRSPILSLDIPSGVDSDTGAILGCAIQAQATISFGVLKQGNLLFPGYALGGTLYHSEISFPPEMYEELLVETNVPPALPSRHAAGHKGSFGKVLIIGGSAQYAGAPTLAAQAALRCGAGYARLALPAPLCSRIFPLVPEAVFLPQHGSVLSLDHLENLVEQAEASNAVVLGPGISTDPSSAELTRQLLTRISVPLVIDGDGLTALAGHEELTRERHAQTILTPHPGEMARLLGSSVSEVEARRLDTAREAADRYGALVALKGAHTVICTPQGREWINLTGNAGMGTAGSGDVLAGMTAALLARSDSFEEGCSDALRLAVHLHGRAGDVAAEELGEDGITASDLVKSLPKAFLVHEEERLNQPLYQRIHPV